VVVKQPPGRPRTKPDPSSPALASRAAALDILISTIDRHRSLDEAVDSALQDRDLEARDRAFTRLLATVTIRRLGQIDDAIARLLDQKQPIRPAAVQHLLRLGATQLIFLQTPAHAAVTTSVDLAEARGLTRSKGLVNAVLRRLSREMPAILHEQDEARLYLPDWLWSRWTAQYGEESTRAAVRQQLTEPALDITLKSGTDAADWAQRLGAQLLPTGTLRRAVGGRVEELPGFSEGAWWIQDAAAALPVRLLGDIAGKRVFDLCAAPGGKTAQLAAAGAAVTAVDRAAPRLALVQSNFSRLHLSAELVGADALAWQPTELADAVLLDAPCTATGTMRRHPDIALGKGPDDLTKLARLQTGLLDRASRLVRPGGRLVYCTCSLEPEEGENQITHFLAGNPDFARIPIRADEIGGIADAVTADGDLRTLPWHLAEYGGMDGFFAARLERKR
jgi:16S rRNA (cytosine967-C5)-methyltransferase